MGTRGRKSVAELSIARIDPDRMPKPTAGLTSELAAEWKSLVPHLVDVSRARWPLIEAYCKHTVALRHVGQLVDEAENADTFILKEYDKLLKMQERESRCLSSLAVRLGIAQTTSYESRKRGQKQKAPWQYE